MPRLGKERCAGAGGFGVGVCTARGEDVVGYERVGEGKPQEVGAAVAGGEGSGTELGVEGFGKSGAEVVGEAEFGAHDGVVVRKSARRVDGRVSLPCVLRKSRNNTERFGRNDPELM